MVPVPVRRDRASVSAAAAGARSAPGGSAAMAPPPPAFPKPRIPPSGSQNGLSIPCIGAARWRHSIVPPPRARSTAGHLEHDSWTGSWNRSHQLGAAGPVGSLCPAHPTKGSDVNNGSPPAHWHRGKQGLCFRNRTFSQAPEIPSLMLFPSSVYSRQQTRSALSAQGACSSSGSERGAFYIPISYPFTIPAPHVTLALPTVPYVDSCQSHSRNPNNAVRF